MLNLKQQFIAAHGGVGVALMDDLGGAVLIVDSNQYRIIKEQAPICLKLKGEEAAVFRQAYIIVILEIDVFPYSRHDKGWVLSGLHGAVYIRTHEICIFYVIDIGRLLDRIRRALFRLVLFPLPVPGPIV